MPISVGVTGVLKRLPLIVILVRKRANGMARESVGKMVQAFAANLAIVDKTINHRCVSVFMRFVCCDKAMQSNLAEALLYVLPHALCRAWLVQN